MPAALFYLLLSGKGFVANNTMRYKMTLDNCDHLGTCYMPFKKLHSPTTFVVHPGLPEDWNFLTFQEIHSPFQYQWIYGLAIFLASVGSVSLVVLYGNDNNGIVTLFVFGILLGFPLSIYWLKNELDWKTQEREISDTYKEPRVIEEITLLPNAEAEPDAILYTTYVYHHFKRNKYIGTVGWSETPSMIDRDNSVVGSSELYVTCCACNTRSKCVKIINYHPSAIYWLGPHSNSPITLNTT